MNLSSADHSVTPPRVEIPREYNAAYDLLQRNVSRAAESLELTALVVITKLDLVRADDGRLDGELQTSLQEYRRIGYPIVLTSAVTGEGLEELRRILKGRISAFVGKSGVGKSALLNALEPGLGLRIGAVGTGRVGKGKHTTTSA